MFSGIIESTAKVLTFEQQGDVFKLVVERPSSFSDIGRGDSVANDGICLTVEEFDQERMQFTVGLETLKVTAWGESLKKGSQLNLERSLKLGDRIHGHLVTGHVDTRAQIVKSEDLGQVWDLDIEIPSSFRKFVWPKGSLTINGVSLTINDVEGGIASFHLIPETLKRTNLSSFAVGDFINIEVDNLARGLIWRKENENE